MAGLTMAIEPDWVFAALSGRAEPVEMPPFAELAAVVMGGGAADLLATTGGGGTFGLPPDPASGAGFLATMGRTSPDVDTDGACGVRVDGVEAGLTLSAAAGLPPGADKAGADTVDSGGAALVAIPGVVAEGTDGAVSAGTTTGPDLWPGASRAAIIKAAARFDNGASSTTRFWPVIGRRAPAESIPFSVAETSASRPSAAAGGFGGGAEETGPVDVAPPGKRTGATAELDIEADRALEFAEAGGGTGRFARFAAGAPASSGWEAADPLTFAGFTACLSGIG